MTVLLAPTSSDDSQPAAGDSHRGRWIWVAVGMLVLLLATFGWWVTHPEKFSYSNATAGAEVAPGESMVFDSGITPGSFDDAGEFTQGTVTITEVTPRVVRNDADAELVLWLCERSQDSGVGIVSAGAIPRFCDPVSEITGEVGSFLYAEQQILVEVTAARPGKVTIAGFDVSYRSGLQFGSEHAGMRISVQASTP